MSTVLEADGSPVAAGFGLLSAPDVERRPMKCREPARADGGPHLVYEPQRPRHVVERHEPASGRLVDRQQVPEVAAGPAGADRAVAAGVERAVVGGEASIAEIALAAVGQDSAVP